MFETLHKQLPEEFPEEVYDKNLFKLAYSIWRAQLFSCNPLGSEQNAFECLSPISEILYYGEQVSLEIHSNLLECETDHSKQPNVELRERPDGLVELVAKREIPAGSRVSTDNMSTYKCFLDYVY